MNNSENKSFPVGMKVEATVDISSLSIKRGDVGYVYENYGTGSSIIFEKGGYDGFSIEEQELFLNPLEININYESYIFTGVYDLISDFRSGYWKFKEEENE